MKKQLLPLLVGALLAPFLVSGVEAHHKPTFQEPAPGLSPYTSLLCSMDGGPEQPWHSKDEGETFTLRNHLWHTNEFTWVGPNSARHNITSDDGQRFHYQDHRNGGGFTLHSLSDTKVIKCDPA